MTFSLDGLETRPAQVWGGVRLVPLVRDEPVPGLRLHRMVYEDPVPFVDVGDGTVYTSFIPHAFVAVWNEDAENPEASYGTRLLEREARAAPPRMPLRRMARKAGRNRLRFLPLHLALEGYLALHFGGPEIAWEEWTRGALAKGLSPRCEETYLGREVRGLEDALRVFEIHPGQCGVLVYVADALASAFAVPHPDDYRALHATLIEDMYGELVYMYGWLRAPAGDLSAGIDGAGIRSLADLRDAARRRQAEWAAFHDDVMAGRLFDEDGSSEVEQYLNGFELSRFLPSFGLRKENHIGETITDRDGRIAYLKTFRLSDAQVKRGFLLKTLAAHQWRLSAAAAALGVDETALALRIERSGFGHLLRQDVLDHYKARARGRGRGRSRVRGRVT
ncbi:ARPP-2 domain-containing protein [Actinomadura welshii]